MRITRRITVEGTPPSAVYAYLKDFTTSEQWDPGADGAGTLLVYEADFTFKGLARLASPFLRGQLTTLGDDAEKALHRELPQL